MKGKLVIGKGNSQDAQDRQDGAQIASEYLAMTDNAKKQGRVVRGFAGRNEKGMFHYRRGEVIEIPAGVDWVRAGLVDEISVSQDDAQIASQSLAMTEGIMSVSVETVEPVEFAAAPNVRRKRGK